MSQRKRESSGAIPRKQFAIAAAGRRPRRWEDKGGAGRVGEGGERESGREGLEEREERGGGERGWGEEGKRRNERGRHLVREKGGRGGGGGRSALGGNPGAAGARLHRKEAD